MPKIVAGIGFFDGVHLGHQSLINEIKSMATEEGTASAVVTFRRHPRSVLSSEYRPQLLNSFNEKMHQNFLLNKHLIQSELVTMMGGGEGKDKRKRKRFQVQEEL